MFQEMDHDGDGEMNFEELLKAFYPMCSEEDILKTIDKCEVLHRIITGLLEYPVTRATDGSGRDLCSKKRP